MDEERTQAWLDSLTTEEQGIAIRLIGMPGGGMASAYLAVELHRMDEGLPERIAEAVRVSLPKPIHGDLLTALFATVLTFGSWFFGGMHR